MQECHQRIIGHHNPNALIRGLMVQRMMTGRVFSGTNTARRTESNTVALTMRPSLLGGTTGGAINRATLNQKKKSEAIGSIT
jgi:hypothetical protein